MFPHGGCLFTDETKAKRYTISIAALATHGLEVARQELRALRLGGQHSLHFKGESDRRRRLILDSIRAQGWQAHIVISSKHNPRLARSDCLREALRTAFASRARSISFELDSSVRKYDSQDLFLEARALGFNPNFRYDLVPRRAEPGLWVADAVAWSFARGGTWRKRLSGIVVEVRQI